MTVTEFAGTENKIKSLTFGTNKRTFSTDDIWNATATYGCPTPGPDNKIIGFHGKADTTGLCQIIADIE